MNGMVLLSHLLVTCLLIGCVIGARVAFRCFRLFDTTAALELAFRSAGCRVRFYSRLTLVRVLSTPTRTTCVLLLAAVACRMP